MPANIARFVDTENDRKTSWENQIARLDKFIRITKDNLELLSNLLSAENDPDSYLTSPAYYAFTGRKGLWVYKEDGAFVLLCWHPNVSGQILVFTPRNDANAQMAIENLLKCIPEPPSGLRFARVKKEDSKNLPFVGDGSHRSVVFAPVIEQVLDWKYPVRILSTEKIAGMEGHAFKRIRNHVYHIMDSDDVVARPLTNEDLPDLKIFIHEWVAEHTYDRHSFDEFISPYNEMISLFENMTLGLSGLLFVQGKKIKALTLWDVSNGADRIANRYVNLCNTSRRGMAEFVMHSVAKHLMNAGIRYLNVGGSETAELDQFKNKFLPAYSIDLCSVDAVIDELYSMDKVTTFPPLRPTGT